jgi:hypothetical protein
MGNLGANYGEKFAKNSMKRFKQKAVAPMITNDKYEGEIKGGGADRVNILTYGVPALTDYTGADFTFDTVTEVEGTMIINQLKLWKFQILDWDKFKSYANDVNSVEIQNAGDQLERVIDAFVLSFYADANYRIGTTYSTGTVAVDVSGNVTGSGTTFLTSMDVAPLARFKCTGLSAWYRVKTFTNATSIVIEDDLDDVSTQYTGGIITAGKAFEIKGYAKQQVTKDTLDGFVLEAKEALDAAFVPATERFLVIPSKIHSILLQTGQLTPYTPSVYEDVVKLGIVGMYRGFKVISNEQVTGNNSDGYHCLAGHPSAITFAMAMTKSETCKLESNFGDGYKGLTCYGAKVLDIRRTALVDMWLYV